MFIFLVGTISIQTLIPSFLQKRSFILFQGVGSITQLFLQCILVLKSFSW
jgi:hypothetical protein